MRDIEVDILIAITTDDDLRSKWRLLGTQPSAREAAAVFDAIQAGVVGRPPSCHPDHLDTWYRALFVLRDRYRGDHGTSSPHRSPMTTSA